MVKIQSASYWYIDEDRITHISQLPSLYNEILNHPTTPDDLRRETESKLLRFNHQLLVATTSIGSGADARATLLTVLSEMVKGMVLIKIPDELAWGIYFNMIDAKETTEYGVAELRAFVEIFPKHDLTRLIGVFLQWNGLTGEEGEEESPIEDDSLDKISVSMLYCEMPKTKRYHRTSWEGSPIPSSRIV